MCNSFIQTVGFYQIMTHSWLFVLLFYFIVPNEVHSQTLLHRGEGIIARENFTYFIWHSPGYLQLVLRTLEGDADLYVSAEIPEPTYELDKYDLYSASCGLDVVYIPHGFKRPLGVGVYGHSAHEKSVYALEIYRVDCSEGFPPEIICENEKDEIIIDKNSSAFSEALLSLLTQMLELVSLHIVTEFML